MQMLRQDVRHGLRMLAKSPGFTIAAVTTLALGIGANTAIFTIVSAVLIRPLPYRDASSLVNVWGRLEKDGIPQLQISEPEYWDLIDRNDSFSEIAAYAPGGSANLARADARPVQVSRGKATSSLFRLLGTTPALGRTFSDDEDQAGHSHVALVSYGMWRSQFGASADVLAQSIRLDGETFSIVGVLPKGFSLGGRHDVWIPLALDRAKPDDRGSHYLHLVARVKRGLSFAEASASLNRFADDLRRTYPNNYTAGGAKDFGVYLVPVKEQLVSAVRPALLVLLGAVGFILLIACVNVANLQLNRAASREKELAIRAALGAGAARLTRQLLTESVMLTLSGGLLGLALADRAIAAIPLVVPADTPRLDEVHLDPLVLAFTFCVCLLTGIVFGLVPAWHIVRRDLRTPLNDAGRTSGSQPGRRLRGVLVVSELALAVLLLTGAGLMIRSVSRLVDVSPGFQPQNLLAMQLSLPEKAYPDGVPVQNFYARLMNEVNAIPGVQSAGAVSQMPLTSSYTSGSVFFEHTPLTDLPRYRPIGNLPYLEVDQRSATSAYFQAMQIPLVRGRFFLETDDANGLLVAIVDANFAQRFWPGVDAIGQRVAVDPIPGVLPQMLPRWRTVVGVVGHVKHYALDVEGREQIYLPHTQPLYGTFVPRDMTLAVRTPLAPAGVTNAVRDRVLAIDKDLALYNVATAAELVSKSVAQPRLNLVVLAAFAALALVLAAVGVYGVIAFGVAQRTQEFGIRMALGASSANVLQQVLIDAGRLTALGLGCGLVSALALTRVMASLLFDVKPTDPVALGLAAGLLAAVALAACYIPARRATRVDPLVALRAE